MMQLLANLAQLCLLICMKDVLCLVVAPVDINSKSACGNKYQYGVFLTSFTLSYDGQYFDGDSCKLQFTNSDVSKWAICIRPKVVDLDCGTKIQYQKYFVATNTHDGELTCDKNNATYFEETCFPYVSEVFIVIKKNNQYVRSIESAKIDVFVKEHKSSVGVSLVVVGAVLTLGIGVLITTVIGIAVCVQKQRQQLKLANATVSYTATTSSITGPQQSNQHSTALNDRTKFSLGCFLNHQTLSAYSNHSLPALTSYNYNSVPQNEQIGSYPETVSELPPSYDSIFSNI